MQGYEAVGVARQYCSPSGKIDNCILADSIYGNSADFIDAARQMTGITSDAPDSTRLNRFVWLSGLRRAVEQCFEETKTESGPDHYEVRKFRGWRQQMPTCIPDHFLLFRKRDMETMLQLIKWIERKNDSAYCSDRKKRVSRL